MRGAAWSDARGSRPFLCHVLYKLKDPGFDFPGVAGALNVSSQTIPELLQRFTSVCEEKLPLLVVFLDDVIDVDTDKNPHHRHFSEVGTDREISGCPEVTYKRIETGKVGIVLKNALELLEKCIGLVVREEAGGHL